MVWAEISEGRTELYMVPRGSVTADRYINEILQDYVVPCVPFIGDNFILMHDNVRPYAALMPPACRPHCHGIFERSWYYPNGMTSAQSRSKSHRACLGFVR
ncbi:unnamed protein product [Psylliodes chrysocephalus]|uniref:Transposase n=1 Tax=Psylliodes chrysocephalus TaxID=3402493 RepID=A0A9P0GLN4_9CUCU|nr:unnamed protein product [Psylliodes chrysocephala]